MNNRLERQEESNIEHYLFTSLALYRRDSGDVVRRDMRIPRAVRRDCYPLQKRQTELPVTVVVTVDVTIGSDGLSTPMATQTGVPTVPSVPAFPSDLTVPAVPSYPFGTSTPENATPAQTTKNTTPASDSNGFIGATPTAASQTTTATTSAPAVVIPSAPFVASNSTGTISPSNSSSSALDISVAGFGSTASSLSRGIHSTSSALYGVSYSTPTSSSSISTTALTSSTIENGETVIGYLTSSGTSTWTAHETLHSAIASQTSESSTLADLITASSGSPSATGGASGGHPGATAVGGIGIGGAAASTSTSSSHSSATAATGGLANNEDDNSVAPTPVIVGSTVGSIAGFILLGMLIILLMKRHKKGHRGAMQQLTDRSGDDTGAMSERSQRARGSWLQSIAFSPFTDREHTDRQYATTPRSAPPSQSGFQKISGRKLPSAFSAGMSSEEFFQQHNPNRPARPLPSENPFADPEDVERDPNYTFYRDRNSSGPVTSRVPGSAPATTAAFSRISGPLDKELEVSGFNKEVSSNTLGSGELNTPAEMLYSPAFDKEVTQRPSPARRPTIVRSRGSAEPLQATSPPMTPLPRTPGGRDPIGRTRPSQDGSRVSSKFTENV